MIKNKKYDNKIVTSLYAYKDHLFIAYLGGNISIHPLPEKLYARQYKQKSIEYSPIIETNNSTIIKMQGYRDYLFTASTKSLYSNYLSDAGKWEEVFNKEIFRCTNIGIDAKRGYLFGVSQTRGLVAINIKNPKTPKYKSDIGFLELEKLSNYHVADLDVYNGTFFLALRNYGILRIDYVENKFGEPSVIRELQKIKLRDPQDVKYSFASNYLYIADADLGFIILDIETGLITYNSTLPNEDIPVQLIPLRNNVVIKGNKGLYYFDSQKMNIVTMLNFDIGPMTSYYNNIYFTKDGDLGRIKVGSINQKSQNLHNDTFKYKYSFVNGELKK